MRPEPVTPGGLLRRWLQADEVRTDDRGWAYNLAIFRIVFLAGAVLPSALAVFGWTVRVLPGLPRDVWVPISFYRHLPFDLLADPSLARALAAVDIGLISLGVLGVCTRWSLGLAALVSLYVFGLPQNQGKVDHVHHLVWFIALLALGPSGRYLSVDALVRRARHAGRALVELAPHSSALLTLRATWLLFGLIYLVPGLAKLEQAVTAGWAGGENLRHILWREWFYRQLYDPTFRMPPRIDTLPWPVLDLFGLGVIAFEIVFIGLVLFRPARPLLAVAGLAFHVGNGVLLNIWFRHLVPAYVCLIDWAALGRFVTGWMRRSPLPVVERAGAEISRRFFAPRTDGGHPSGDRRRGRIPTSPSLSLLLGSALLILFQLSISGLMFAQEVAARSLASDHPVRRGLAAVAGQRPVWPFDTYPTFAGRATPHAEVWEARAVLADGRELRISPRAYQNALGSTARSGTATRAIRQERDPERHRARSLELVRLLWRHEADALREATVAIRVYHGRYTTDPSEPSPRDQRLIHTFPVESVRRR